MSFRDDSFEFTIFERMVFDHDCEPLIGRIHGRSFGNGPGFEDTGNLQPKIVMETRGMVFMDDKSHMIHFFYRNVCLLINAAKHAVIPKRKRKIDEDMTLNLYQLGLLFKWNSLEFGLDFRL
jgi:hypothetical protein